MLLETSYLVDYETGREAARAFFESHANESLSASTISAFELGFGVALAGTDAFDVLRDSLTWVEFLEFSVDDALEAARLQAELESAGERIPVPDVMIAGVARNRGATLVAADAHFDSVDGLDVIEYRGG